jgi:IS30 family transposase
MDLCFTGRRRGVTDITTLRRHAAALEFVVNERSGLLRRHLSKSRSFITLTPVELPGYVWQLNDRPRKRLNYKNPAEVFHQRTVALRM